MNHFLWMKIYVKFLMSHQCHSNRHNHHMRQMVFTLSNIKNQLSPLNMFHLFDQNRIKNILCVSFYHSLDPPKAKGRFWQNTPNVFPEFVPWKPPKLPKLSILLNLPSPIVLIYLLFIWSIWSYQSPDRNFISINK